MLLCLSHTQHSAHSLRSTHVLEPSVSEAQSSLHSMLVSVSPLYAWQSLHSGLSLDLQYVSGTVCTQGSSWICNNMCAAQSSLEALQSWISSMCMEQSTLRVLLRSPICVWHRLHSGLVLDFHYVCVQKGVCGWGAGSWGGVGCVCVGGGGGSQEGSTRQNDSEIETERRSERETNIESHRDKHDTIKFMFSQHFCSGLT